MSWDRSMQVETKYLYLRQEIALGEDVDGWKVCWLGGWGRDRLFYAVMVARVKIDPACFTECAQRCASWEEDAGAGRGRRRKRGWRDNQKEDFGSIVPPKLIAKKKRRGRESKAATGGGSAAMRVCAFPKPDDVVSDRIIFDIGGDRFAIRWTAEIERLPPRAHPRRTEATAEAGPLASKKALNFGNRERERPPGRQPS